MPLEFVNISKAYANSSKNILENLNLKIEDGEFVCIVGRSGCGKSTLLNLASGLEQPSAGKIILDGKEVTNPGAERVVMFQEHALFPWLNVIDNVAFGLKMAGMSKKMREEKAMHYLQMVHLENFQDYKIQELSGGMRQRVALARALAMDAKMLLMDEPFSALDKQTANAMREQLQQIWMETKKTILFITHSVEEAVYLADRVVVLSHDAGEIKRILHVSVERPREVYDPAVVALRHEVLDEIRKDKE